jgi:hypothetical protein
MPTVLWNHKSEISREVGESKSILIRRHKRKKQSEAGEIRQCQLSTGLRDRGNEG